MGKPNLEPQVNVQTDPITHFSHPHPLHLSNLQPQQSFSFCSACKLYATGSLYSCTLCNFILHPRCYELPQKIKHPFDQKHTLYLHPKPAYPEGLFNCDACGNSGDGFSYHCSPCGVDLHSICASLPLKFVHHCHHHELSLTFSSPYPGNSFSCDVCKRLGSKTWLYRCTICEFDVHLTCVKTIIPTVSIAQNTPHVIRTRSAPNTAAYGVPTPRPVVMGQVQNQFGATPFQSATPQMPCNTFNQPVYGGVATPQMPYNTFNLPVYGGVATPVNGGLRDQMLVGVGNGVASGVAQAATQVLLQGLFSGGGGGGGSNGDAMGDGVVMVDGGLYNDGGMGGGYSGGDGSGV